MTSDVFYDPNPGGVGRWGARGYLSAEMESAAVFLLAMRERARAGAVRAGTILTVSDVILDPGRPRGAAMLGAIARSRELQSRIDRTIG